MLNGTQRQSRLPRPSAQTCTPPWFLRPFHPRHPASPHRLCLYQLQPAPRSLASRRTPSPTPPLGRTTFQGQPRTLPRRRRVLSPAVPTVSRLERIGWLGRLL